MASWLGWERSLERNEKRRRVKQSKSLTYCNTRPSWETRTRFLLWLKYLWCVLSCRFDVAIGLIFFLQFPPSQYFPSDPKLAYDSFGAHASITGNATSQGFLAFFHATGYQKVVPVDQARAQLYYTFAANGGDKGSQMALAYRYWSGIGTLEDCSRAVDWYERAAGQGMSIIFSR